MPFLFTDSIRCKHIYNGKARTSIYNQFANANTVRMTRILMLYKHQSHRTIATLKLSLMVITAYKSNNLIERNMNPLRSLPVLCSNNLFFVCFFIIKH